PVVHAEVTMTAGCAIFPLMDVAGSWVEVGGRIRETRLAAGLTQGEVARRVGLDRTAVVRIEAGRRAGSPLPRAPLPPSPPGALAPTPPRRRRRPWWPGGPRCWTRRTPRAGSGTSWTPTWNGTPGTPSG